MEFPLAERELARHGRMKRTYFLRMIAGGFAALAALGGIANAAGNPFNIERLGATLAEVSLYFQFAASVLLPPLLTAGLIAREKQERTLGLLMLAEYRGFEVFLSKFLSAFVYIELLILSALPILAFAAIFGGISVVDVTLQTFLFSLTAIAACAIGMLCSTLTKTTGAALFVALACMGLWFPASIVLQSLLAPGSYANGLWHTAIAAGSVSDSAQPVWFWVPSAILSLGIALLCSALAALLLPRQVYERPQFSRSSFPRRRESSGVHPEPEVASHPLDSRLRGNDGIPEYRRTLRRRERNPVQVLFNAGAPGFSNALKHWTLKVIASIGLAAITFLPCLGFLFVAAMAAYDIVLSFHNARRNQVFSDLRLTGPEPRDLLRDIFRVQFRRSMLYFPAFTIAAVSVSPMTLVYAPYILSDKNGPLLLLPIAAALLLGLSQVELITAIGCYEGRRAPKALTASVWTVLILYVQYIVVSVLATGALWAITFMLVTNLGRMDMLASTNADGYYFATGALLVLAGASHFFAVIMYRNYIKTFERYV